MNIELGFALAALAGLSLGLVGGGGSLLTVPILIYGFQVSAVLGTAYSLFIVGVTSFVGAVMAFQKNQIDFRVAWIFTPPGFLGIFLSRKFILHELPERLSIGGHFSFSRENALMGVFGLVMVLAAILTLRKPDQNLSANQNLRANESEMSISNLAILGLTVGVLTGFFGAGGGFLIVPALILFAALPMGKAVGTSLAIMAANAWFGLISDLGHHQLWNWRFVISFTGFSLAGVFLGRYFNSRIRGTSLKTAFSWLVLILGVGIFLKELAQGKI